MNNKNLTIPIAIVIAGIIIGGSFFITRKNNSNEAADTENLPAATLYDQKKDEPKTDGNTQKSDHILGNSDAEITIIEYSDTECPFCKKFHETMTQIMDEYGKTGKVKWIYRHFPLDMLHSKSRKEAEATECATELGGNIKFWEYINRLYAITPSNDGLDPSELTKIAEYAGLDKNKFEECLKSGRHAQDVENDLQDGMSAGIQGTPSSIVISKKGEKFPLNGYVPFQQLKVAIDQLLSQGN